MTTLEIMQNEMRRFNEIVERHHDEMMDYNKSTLEIRQDIKDMMIKDATTRKEERKEDRSLAKTNLVVFALVAILSTAATLIAAKILPWFH